MRATNAIGVAVLIGLAGTAHGQVAYTVQVLPGLDPGDPGHVSIVTQGGVAVGTAWDGSETRPVRWVNGVPQPLTAGPQSATFYWINGHSGDTIVGQMRVNDVDYAFRWDPGIGLQPIMTVPGSGDDSYAAGINSSGAVAGGRALRAVHWTSGGGFTLIQFANTPPVPDYGGAAAINDSGVVVGYAGHAAGPMPNDGLQAFRWTAASGIERLDVSFGGSYAIATDINAAGDIIGYASTVDFPNLGPDKAFLWRNGVVTMLGDPDPVSGMAVAINDAGEVLGYDGDPLGIGIPDLDHWVWINGTKHFIEPVTTGIPAGFEIEAVRDMNNAGTIAAQLVNPSTFDRLSVLLVRDGGCYPDCSGDGVLTVADFGCFQTKFVQGDPYTDCNGDGQRTVADFGCFQTRFVQGCP